MFVKIQRKRDYAKFNTTKPLRLFLLHLERTKKLLKDKDKLQEKVQILQETSFTCSIHKVVDELLEIWVLT